MFPALALVSVVSGVFFALPMLCRVGLVMGDFDVLGGEWGADWPGKKKQAVMIGCYDYLHPTVSTHASCCCIPGLVATH